MEIEKKLKAARLNAGMTQEQVAEKIMVSRQTISNWETGKSLPVLFVVVVYLLSVFIGGVFYDFCKNAIIWILMGLGVAFSIVYLKQKE